MPGKARKPLEATSLSELMSPSALRLLTASGSELFRQIGMNVVRGVVLDILTGKNLRDSTEILTRRRIATLNLAIVDMFLRGSATSASFVRDLPHLATDILARKRLSKAERWVAQWVLGLTDKAFQNVLRDSHDSLAVYRDRYIETCREVVAGHEQESGRLAGVFVVDSGMRAEVSWLLMTYLLNTVGMQASTIRGSEKSIYGKLFEKLILGSLLCILGFKQVPPGQPQKFKREFWLASREKRREADATLLFDVGKAVRFDLGFIGRGNTEISLDKVTRFEHLLTLEDTHWYTTTIIIVDRIGERSRIEKLAEEVNGFIVQMSASYWPQRVAQILNRELGYNGPLVRMGQNRVADFLERRLNQVLLEHFIKSGGIHNEAAKG